MNGRREPTLEELDQIYPSYPDYEGEALLRQVDPDLIPGSLDRWRDWLSDPSTHYWFSALDEFLLECEAKMETLDGQPLERAVGAFLAVRKIKGLAALIIQRKQTNNIEDYDENDS